MKRNTSVTIEGLKPEYDTPELNLWATVFSIAVGDYLDHGKNKRTAQSRKAEYWIFHDKRNHFASFENLCLLFGLDAVRVRKHLLRRKESGQ